MTESLENLPQESTPDYLNQRDVLRAFVESFGLSQGDLELHNCLMDWLVHHYTQDDFYPTRTAEAVDLIEDEDAIRAATKIYSTLVKQQSHPEREDSEGTAREIWSAFSSRLQHGEEQGEDARNHKDFIRETLFNLIDRDRRLLLQGRDRTQTSSEYKSLFVDFVLLKKGKGYLSYNRFRKLWEPLFDELRDEALHPERDSKDPDIARNAIITLLDLWKEKTNPSLEDFAVVNDFLKTMRQG